ncbi:hypothetical protein [Bacteroides heparinolyticus]|uniref:hypothetical protein n=1 Tax=Prevotella heparinolytica TaxID=28113 RepID=UPI0035A0B060
MKRNFTFCKRSVACTLLAIVMAVMAHGAWAQNEWPGSNPIPEGYDTRIQEPLPSNPKLPSGNTDLDGCVSYARYLWSIRDAIGGYTTKQLWNLKDMLKRVDKGDAAVKTEIANFLYNTLGIQNGNPAIEYRPGVYKIFNPKNTTYFLAQESGNYSDYTVKNKLNSGWAAGAWNATGPMNQGFELGNIHDAANGNVDYFYLFNRNERKHMYGKGEGTVLNKYGTMYTGFQASPLGGVFIKPLVSASGTDKFGAGRVLLQWFGLKEWGAYQFIELLPPNNIIAFDTESKTKSYYNSQASDYSTAYDYVFVPDRLNNARKLVALQGAWGFYRGSELSKLKDLMNNLESASINDLGTYPNFNEANRNEVKANIDKVIDEYDRVMYQGKEQKTDPRDLPSGYYRIVSASDNSKFLYDTEPRENKLMIGFQSPASTRGLRTDVWALTRTEKGATDASNTSIKTTEIYLRNHNSGYAYHTNDIGRFVQEPGSGAKLGTSPVTDTRYRGSDIMIATIRKAFRMENSKLGIPGYYQFTNPDANPGTRYLYHTPSNSNQTVAATAHSYADDWNAAFIMVPVMELNAKALLDTKNMVGSFKAEDMVKLEKAYNDWNDNKTDENYSALWDAYDELTIDNNDKRLKFADKNYFISWATTQNFDANVNTVLKNTNGVVEADGKINTDENYNDMNNQWKIVPVAGKANTFTIVSAGDATKKIVLPTASGTAVTLGSGSEIIIVPGTSGRTADFDVIYRTGSTDYYLYRQVSPGMLTTTTQSDMGLINWNFQQALVIPDPEGRKFAYQDFDRVDALKSTADTKELRALIEAYDAEPTEAKAQAFNDKWNAMKDKLPTEMIPFEPLTQVYRIHSGWQDGVLNTSAAGITAEHNNINPNELFVLVPTTVVNGNQRYRLMNMAESKYYTKLTFNGDVTFEDHLTYAFEVEIERASFWVTDRDNQDDRKYLKIVSGPLFGEDLNRFFRSAAGDGSSENAKLTSYGYTGLNAGGYPYDRFMDFSLEPLPQDYTAARLKYLRDLDRVNTYWSTDVKTLAALVKAYETDPNETTATAMKAEYDRLETALADKKIKFVDHGVYRVHSGWKQGVMNTSEATGYLTQTSYPRPVGDKEQMLYQCWTFVPVADDPYIFYMKNAYTSDYYVAKNGNNGTPAANSMTSDKAQATRFRLADQTVFTNNDLNNQPTRFFLEVVDESGNRLTYMNDAGGEHENLLTWNEADSNSDFTIEPIDFYPVTIGQYKAITFSHDRHLIQPGKLKAYKAHSPKTDRPRDIQTEKIIEERGVYQDNGERNGIIFWSNTPETYELIYTELENNTIDYSGNKLVGTFNSSLTSNAGNEPWVLNVRNGELWFNRLNAGKTLGANKAYLPNNTFPEGSSGAKVTFKFDDDTVTSITIQTGDSNQTDSTEEDCYYDLTGRRITAPQSGVYIRNGKKIVK